MKKNNMTFLLVLLLFAAAIPVQAQVVANKSGKCGYVDENGKLIIPYKYDFIAPFSEYNTAIVKKGKKFGLVDRNGNVVLPLKYTQIGKIENGNVVLMKGNKYGLASADGRLLHKPEYVDIAPFNSQGVSLVVVKKKKNAKMYESTNTVALLRNDGKELVRTNAFALAQLVDDNDILRVYQQDADTFNTSSGYFFDSKTQSYYNLDGEVVMNDNIRNNIFKQLFGKGANVKNIHSELSKTEYNPSSDIMAFKYNQKIDKTHIIMSAGYYDLKNQRILFSRNYASTRTWDSKANSYSFIADTVFVNNKRYYDGFAIATITGAGEQSGDYLLDTKGRVIHRFPAKKCYNYKHGFMVVGNADGLYGLMNTNQELVVPYKYNTVKTAVNDHGLWAVKDGDKWGALRTTGETIVPFQYDRIIQWQEGDVLFVQKDKKWGAYQEDKEVLPCNYDSLYSYIHHSFVVKKDKKYGMYSLRRQTLSPMFDGYVASYNADSIYHGSQLRMFYNLSENKKVETYGFLNSFCEEVVPFMFNTDDLAYKAYKHLRDKPLREFTDTERFRLHLLLTRRTRTYSFSSTIPTNDWDY